MKTVQYKYSTFTNFSSPASLAPPPTCSTILSTGTLLRLLVEPAAAAAPWADDHRHNNLLPLASTLQNTFGNKLQTQNNQS